MGFSYAGESGKGNYGNSNARAGYGYSRGLSGRVSYSLAMPKNYGTDVNLDSYLMRGRKGISGYVGNLIKCSLASLKAGYSYLGQKKQELYKVEELMRNYELKKVGTMGNPGLIMPQVSMYDLSSARMPVSNLERRLNLN
jgi:hypothetical protein